MQAQETHLEQGLEESADEDARVAKMKDGRTHLAHKAEHAVDLDTGAVVQLRCKRPTRATRQPWTRRCAKQACGAELVRREASCSRTRSPGQRRRDRRVGCGQGYHSGAVVQRMKSYDVRSYIPEKRQKGSATGRARRATTAVYRIGGGCEAATARAYSDGARIVERSFAHCYETGGCALPPARRENILKRQLVHVGAFNLSLILRKLLGAEHHESSRTSRKPHFASAFADRLPVFAGERSNWNRLPQVRLPQQIPIKLHTRPCRIPAHCTTDC